MIEGDLVHRAGGAGNFHKVSDGKGVGRENHQSAGYVAQDILGCQGNAQRPHRQQSHQRGHVDVQAVGHNQRGDNIEQQPDPGKDIFLYPLVQLGAGEQFFGQLEQYRTTTRQISRVRAAERMALMEKVPMVCVRMDES